MENEKEINYQDSKILDEQIKMAEQELYQFELQCSAQINFRRGNLNALQRIKEKKPIFSKTPTSPPI